MESATEPGATVASEAVAGALIPASGMQIDRIDSGHFNLQPSPVQTRAGAGAQLPTQWSVLDYSSGFGFGFGFGPLRDCDGECDSDFDDAFTCRNSRMRSGASRWPDYAHDMLIYMRCQSPREVLLWAIDGHASQAPSPSPSPAAAATAACGTAYGAP
ncbi:hypothetical protein AWZ03_005057 [Drosophila navojoa]|uniref:Uncharacterized protein n=1 Tax=Drosophila navojoa TaxID=7232 RepID=A0A484BIA0_DRONA|nr:hypothetical protein AWZ03_005057 [Drosophila navojoa]